MRRIWLWMGFVGGIAFGAMGLAMALSTAIQQVEIQSAVITLIGTIAGTGITVSGAFMLWKVQDNRIARNVASAIRSITEDFVRVLDQTIIWTSSNRREVHETVLKDQVHQIMAAGDEALRLLARYDEHLLKLNVEQLRALRKIEKAIKQMITNVQTTTGHGSLEMRLATFIATSFVDSRNAIDAHIVQVDPSGGKLKASI